MTTAGKVVTREELAAKRAAWRGSGLSVVFTNGCYDLLHPGHISFLEQARALGDRLIVGVNADISVRRNKGESRPITPERERAEILAALRAIDAVTIFPEDTPLALIEAIMPDVLVKGEDWSHLVVGREVVEAADGEVVLLPLVDGISTTALVERIRATVTTGQS